MSAIDTMNDALLCFETLRASSRTVTGALLLDAERHPIGVHTIGIGSNGRCCVDPRDLLRPALDAHPVSIILAHTHPHGDPTPREADTAMTATAMEALKIVRITLLDHIVLAPRRSFSYAERGLLPAWVEAA